MKEHEAGNTLSLEEFEQIIGYTFHDKQLLQEALSHSSYANEKKKLRRSNERLEFLGDSVLSIVVSQYLFKHFTHLPEGELTKIRASLVCEKSLHVFAQKIRLGDAILLGKGEENTGGRTRPSILADAFEAVIAAIFLDGGNSLCAGLYPGGYRQPPDSSLFRLQDSAAGNRPAESGGEGGVYAGQADRPGSQQGIRGECMPELQRDRLRHRQEQKGSRTDGGKGSAGSDGL